MFRLPKDSSSLATIVGIDPGSDTVGFAILTIDVTTMCIVDSKAWTLSGSKLAGKDSWTEELYGNREARIQCLENRLLELFLFFQPLSIASEAPFINNKFPQAGIALTEVICAIRRAVSRYFIWRQLYLIPPSNVKNAVSAGGGVGKDIMRNKVIALKSELNYTGIIPLEMLDEHSIDGIAVAYTQFKRYRDEYV